MSRNCMGCILFCCPFCFLLEKSMPPKWQRNRGYSFRVCYGQRYHHLLGAETQRQAGEFKSFPMKEKGKLQECSEWELLNQEAEVGRTRGGLPDLIWSVWEQTWSSLVGPEWEAGIKTWEPGSHWPGSDCSGAGAQSVGGFSRLAAAEVVGSGFYCQTWFSDDLFV